MQETLETQVQSLGWEDPLEEGMAAHSSILAWRIPWTEEPGGLQSMGLQRVRYDWGDFARTHHYDGWAVCAFLKGFGSSGGGWNLACPPPAQPPTTAQVFFDPVNRAFSQISLPGHRRYALRRRLPRVTATEQAISSSDENHTHWVPNTFIFPKGGESAKSLFNRIPVSSEHGSRFSPGGIRNTRSPPVWHRNQILPALCASRLILPTASIISRLLSGAFRVAGQAPEPQGGHSVLWGSKPLNMPLEYFSHFKKGYGSRECPATAFKSGPCWALIWQVSPSD